MAFQGYSKQPKYVFHGNTGGLKEDTVYILACQIKVWKPVGNKWFDIPSIESDNCTVLTEVESIDIKNSFKELISTATVTIPRGTIISKYTKVGKELKVGQNTSLSDETDKDTFTQDGQMITPESMTYKTGESTVPIRAFRSEEVDFGAILVMRSSADRVATDSDFSIGSRIQIKAGYVVDLYDENGKLTMSAQDRLEEVRMMDDADELKIIFTGFITGCSAASPLEIQCENMASLLKKIHCPRIVAKGNVTVNDFLQEGGRYNLLKDTGISLSPISSEAKIDIGKVNVDSNVRVSEILEQWSKNGIMTFMEPDGKHIRVGFASYMGTESVSDLKDDKNMVTYSDDKQVFIAQFDWDVASDELKIVHGNKKFLAVRATGTMMDGDKEKKFSLTIRPKYKESEYSEGTDSGEVIVDENGVEFDVINESHPEKKLGRLKKDGTRGKAPKGYTIQKTEESRVKLENYEVIPLYMANTTRAKLLEEAKKLWKSHSPNGISGSVTFFGDVEINVADTIGLIDLTRPEVNGYFIVESVDIDFGTGGYRKKVKILNKVGKFSKIIKDVKEIE